jgi:hypothetical protein
LAASRNHVSKNNFLNIKSVPVAAWSDRHLHAMLRTSYKC